MPKAGMVNGRGGDPRGSLSVGRGHERPRPAPPRDRFSRARPRGGCLARRSVRQESAPSMDTRVSAHLPLSARLVLAMLTAAAMALGGCKKKAADGGAGAASLLDPDGGGEIVAIAVPDGGSGAGAAAPMLHALALITPVMNVPEWAPRDPSTASDDRKSA